MDKVKFLKECVYKVVSSRYAEVADFIMQYSHLLQNETDTLDFIHKIKKNISKNELVGIDTVFLKFVRSYLQSFSLKIVFIGSGDNYERYQQERTFPAGTELHYLDRDEIPSLPALLQQLGFNDILCVYDLNSKSQLEGLLSLIPAYMFIPMSEMNYLLDIQLQLAGARSLHHYSLNRALNSYFSNDRIDQLIIGSSYPWAAFPEKILSRSANLSMHCADINFSKSVIMGSYAKKQMGKIILFLGPYDLYYELSHSTNLDILSTFHSLKSFCQEHDISYVTTNSMTYDYVFGFSKEIFTKDTFSFIMMDSIFYNTPQNRDSLYAKLQYLNSIAKTMNDPDQHSVKCYRENSNKRKYSREYKCNKEHKNTCKERAIKHSRHYKYKQSFINNKKHFQELMNFVEKNDIEIKVIMSPFPREYLKHFDKEMIRGSRQFFHGVKSEKFEYIDLLEDGDFTNADFYDGDHLNFTGAEKVREKLLTKGITV